MLGGGGAWGEVNGGKRKTYVILRTIKILKRRRNADTQPHLPRNEEQPEEDGKRVLFGGIRGSISFDS